MQKGAYLCHSEDCFHNECGVPLIQPLPEGDEERQLIERIVADTHAPTHNTWKLKIKSVFKCDRSCETERFNTGLDNRMLLWHGSRLVRHKMGWSLLKNSPLRTGVMTT